MDKKNYSPGWYRLRMRAGNFVPQNIFLSYVDAEFSSPEIVQLLKFGKRIDQVIMFPASVQYLNISSESDPEKMGFDDFDLIKLSKIEALWHLFAGVRRNESLGWMPLMKEIISFAVSILQYGLKRSAEKLYERYKIPANGYVSWIGRYENYSALKLLDKRNDDPLISVLLPVGNSSHKLLVQSICSVLDQIFAHWELCIVADRKSTSLHELLATYAASDVRIRLHFCDCSDFVSKACLAFEMASGEFVLLFNEFDVLSRYLILEIIKILRQRPAIDFFYTDEDCVDVTGSHRSDPKFKPGWNFDLLLSKNYIGGAAVIRKSVISSVGIGIGKGYGQYYQYALFLRCVSMLDASRIFHIPKILYHRCFNEKFLARSGADNVGMRVVSDYLASNFVGASVIQLTGDCCRIKWPLPKPLPKVALIIPTRDRVDLLKVCVNSILEKTDYLNYEILIVDNQSKCVETLDFFVKLQQHQNIRIISFDAPFNYSAINNHAVAQTDADVIGLINNDIEVINPDWLSEMVSHAVRSGVGAVGAMLYYPNNTIQHAGVVLGLGVGAVAGHIYHDFPRGAPGYDGRILVAQNVSAVTGACLVVERKLYLECGGLDEINLSVAFNDVDFCLRLLELGCRNVWTPFAELYHHESVSRGDDDTPEKNARFMGEINYMRCRWDYILDDDPAYNPNLTLVRQDSSMAFPPRVRMLRSKVR